MYSVVETARTNGANVYWYLRYVLEKMPHDAERLDEEFLEAMMPWSQEYLEYEKMQKSDGSPGLKDNEYRERPKSPKKKRKRDGEDLAAKIA